MGEASGHFSYIEDPDGTLIEFVETYKIPVIKKIGWYLSLEKRDPKKPLPTWLLKMLLLGQAHSYDFDIPSGLSPVTFIAAVLYAGSFIAVNVAVIRDAVRKLG